MTSVNNLLCISKQLIQRSLNVPNNDIMEMLYPTITVFIFKKKKILYPISIYKYVSIKNSFKKKTLFFHSLTK